MADPEWRVAATGAQTSTTPESIPRVSIVNQRPWQSPTSSPFQARSNHGYRGVTYDRDNNSWRSRLYCTGRHITLGRYATAKLAAEAHDRAAYYVRGEGAVTNFGIAAARKDWESCPQQFSTVVRRGLQAAAERLQAIEATGGAKAGTQQRHPRAHSGFDDGPIGMRAAATRAIAATLAGALPSPTI